MKTLLSILVVALLSVNSLFAQADQNYVSNWVFPIDFWFTGAVAPEPYTHNQAIADTLTTESFDPASVDFDTQWAQSSGNGYAISKLNNTSLAASYKGANDFVGAFKVFYDDSNMYIMLKYTDDDVTGEETVEICMSPYYKVDATAVSGAPGAWYVRYDTFGAYKATFKKTGFNEAMIVKHNASGVGSIGFSDKPSLLVNNLFLNDRTEIGSNVVKQIITVGFASLTGTARPNFDTQIWKQLNDGKGISFDIKVNDTDGDDAMTTDANPVKKSADFWWNSDNNDCWQSNTYAGFLAKRVVTGVKSVMASNSIFNLVTSEKVELKKEANITVFNVAGKQVLSLQNVRNADLSKLSSGLFVIRVNNETVKVVR